MLGTRPNLAYACGMFSRFNSKPSQHHLDGLKRVYRYVKRTVNYGITYGIEGKEELLGYTDSAFADDRDKDAQLKRLEFCLSGAFPENEQPLELSRVAMSQGGRISYYPAISCNASYLDKALAS